MRTLPFRLLFALVATMLSALGLAAGTITVTSPTSGAFLGSSATLTFNISGAKVEVKVHADVKAPDGSVTPYDTTVTPNTDGNATGSIPLTFGDASPEGAYTIKVTATEVGNTYNSPPEIPVTVDHTDPKFVELSPVSGGFTKGLVRIRASVEEANIKKWRVQVNSQDIPNGAGEGNTISVDYDPTNLTTDRTLNIAITVTDKADNVTTKTISITLDRVKPTVQIVYPTTTTRISSGQDVTVLIDITDASTSSIDRTGVDVIAKGTDGRYLARVTLVSFKATSGTTQRWSGRIRYQKGQLPSRFVISAQVVDKAGNAATIQEVSVRYGK